MRVIFYLLIFCCVGVFAQTPNVDIEYIGSKKDKEAFSFIHITDTHIGEGTPGRDYGTKGFYDTLTGNEWGYPASRLSNAVRWINDNYAKNDIHFVIASGDLTDSGEKSEFLHFKKLMDSLKIPYFPLIGNHDAWSYNRFGDEAPKANGDSIMNEVFGTTFNKLDSAFVLRNSSRLKAWWDTENNATAYLQNYHYSYNGISFVFLDFNPRYHVRKNEPGIGPEAQLHEGVGGTLSFLQQAIKTAKRLDERVVLISHHPPIASIVGFHYAFTAKEKMRLSKVIKPFRKTVLAWFAGHIHRQAKYGFTKAKMLRIIETKANKAQDFGGFRVVKVRK